MLSSLLGGLGGGRGCFVSVAAAPLYLLLHGNRFTNLFAFPNSYNPYALDVVPFTAVEPNDFYTMSVRGVTHYINGITADFTNLDQWEREYQLFNAMCTLTVFNKYKAWCAFKPPLAL
eukprot:1190568-Prorocentrum_minimum.AAC.7